jgi:transposase
MPRYKDYSYDQDVMIPLRFSEQILPGTFEYTLNQLIDEKLDLSIFDLRYKNDETGSPAYDPAILLKIILYAYSKGIISSRKIEKLCQENVVCMALSADTHPHFTTIADFVSSMNQECIQLFTKILAICYSENLIGKTMFAIDGCKISSNCSKEWSGTKKDMLSKVEKIKKAVTYLVTKHAQTDRSPGDDGQIAKEKESIRKLNEKIEKITEWMETHEDRIGSQGKPIKSNITDNESAKMATSHGVIQGYNGIAAVDEKCQTIIWAEAFGDANESSHLPEILTGIKETCKQTGIDSDVYKSVKITADSGYHNEKNMEVIHERGIDAYIADNQFRKRDVRFDDVGKYKKKIAAWEPNRGKQYFDPGDFHLDSESKLLICPAGKPMWLKCANYRSSDGKHIGKAYMGHVASCNACPLRSRCMRKATTKARQVVIFELGGKGASRNYSSWMRERFDTVHGRSVYSRRMGTVEPVFGHIAGTKKLNRFTLRGKNKVNNQWLLFCMVHNIEKIRKYGK